MAPARYALCALARSCRRSVELGERYHRQSCDRLRLCGSWPAAMGTARIGHDSEAAVPSRQRGQMAALDQDLHEARDPPLGAEIEAFVDFFETGRDARARDLRRNELLAGQLLRGEAHGDHVRPRWMAATVPRNSITGRSRREGFGGPSGARLTICAAGQSSVPRAGIAVGADARALGRSDAGKGMALVMPAPRLG